MVGVDNHNDYYDVALKEKRKKCLNTRILFKQDINDIVTKESNFDLAINLAAQAGVRVESNKEYLYQHSNIDGFSYIL